MTEIYSHPFVPVTDTHKVQRIMLLMPVLEGNEAQHSIKNIATLAGTGYGTAKETLSTASCISTKRTGGPKASREEADPKTVGKVFDATLEPKNEGLMPEKCKECPFSNYEKRTAIRNRPTQGCIILGVRRRMIEGS